jgi:hypothetical protein
MPVCKGCGSSFEEKFQFCPHCGRAKPEPEQVKILIHDPSGLACPYCQHADRVEKVSAIISAQTVSIKGQSRGTSVGINLDGNLTVGNSRGQYSGTEVSRLAALLQKPRIILFKPILQTKAAAQASISGAVLAILFSLVILVFTISILFETTFSFPHLVLFTIAGLCLWYGYASINHLNNFSDEKAMELYQKKLAEYESKNRVSEAWENLYYCYRDGRIFIPGEKDSAPVEQMLAFIQSKA